MTRVWIAQCLCPERHALMATAAEAGSEVEAQAQLIAPLRETIRAAIESGEINPWCGLCHAGADTWRYEVGRTRFPTMAAAMPELQEAARQNDATRAMFGDMPRSD